jgi:hypothetical protein
MEGIEFCCRDKGRPPPWCRSCPGRPVDFDVGLRNLDLVLGAERRVVFDLINVINGFAKLSQRSFATNV